MKPILQNGAPVLREVAVRVPEELFGSFTLQEMLKDMADALDKEPDGVALAAPQIGYPYRMFIVRLDRTRPTAPGEDGPAQKVAPEVEVYINPEMTRRSRKKQESDEGCLSVRGLYGKTRRPERATVRARRADGTRFEKNASDLLAQIFDHEIDHLNGILFIDHADEVLEVPHEEHA